MKWIPVDSSYEGLLNEYILILILEILNHFAHTKKELTKEWKEGPKKVVESKYICSFCYNPYLSTASFLSWSLSATIWAISALSAANFSTCSWYAAVLASSSDFNLSKYSLWASVSLVEFSDKVFLSASSWACYIKKETGKQ